LTADVKRIFGEEESKIKERVNIIYGRVSSKKQEEDLGRQIDYLGFANLKKLHPDYEVIKDIGSGLNFQRKGLNLLLEKCSQGTVARVVVTNKDRLARYGVELILWIFRKYNVEIIIQFKEGETEFENELSEDIISIITVFTARYHRKRSAESKRRRKELEQEEGEEDEESQESGREDN